MKFDLTAPLVDPWGKALVEGPDSTPVTLGNVVASAFVSPAPADETLKMADKQKHFDLACRFAVGAGGSIDLTPEDLAAVRARVAAVYRTAVAGPALRLLEQPEA